MEGILVTWTQLLIAGAILGVALVVVLAVSLLRRKRPDDMPSVINEGKLTRMQKELATLQGRIDAIEHYLIRGEPAAPREPLPEPEPTVVDEEVIPAPYSQAMLMARDGLDADELARRCGISISEASLIVAMQRQQQGRS
jgi:hypothetical protein